MLWAIGEIYLNALARRIDEITLQAAKSISSQMRELQNRFVVELFVESAA